MSIQKTKSELQDHKNKALSDMSSYLDGLINSDDTKLNGKADKLCYWISDWCRFLDFEQHFSSKSLRRYKRGEIIKVHLGFNVGSEEGGLHYAVVIDKDNARSCPTVTIVPLTSVKPSIDITDLKNGSIFLGNELFINLNAKISATSKHLYQELDLLNNILEKYKKDFIPFDINDLENRIKYCNQELLSLGRMRTEVHKMKNGSIALVNQITTISKIRIYDPKTDHDVLSNIKLSNEKLDLLDNEIRKKYTNI